ncbi:MAG: SCO family protein [Pseudomonadota bacterium]
MNTKQPRGRNGLLALTLLLAACTADAPAERPLAGTPIGGAFALTAADGSTVTNDSLKGAWRLVYFGYTFCPDICPVDAERMGRAYAQLERAAPDLAARLTPIFISVDPARDTPEIADEFAKNFHPDMIGLSGDQAAIDQAVDAYLVAATREPAREDGFYLMAHSAYIYLMDDHGDPVNTYDREATPDMIAEDVRRWMGA